MYLVSDLSLQHGSHRRALLEVERDCSGVEQLNKSPFNQHILKARHDEGVLVMFFFLETSSLEHLLKLYPKFI